MTVERADLSGSLNLDPMAPVSAAPAVQGQALPGGEQGKPRRRPPLPEEASTDLSETEPAEADSDPPPHRIDSLA
jgi:hypothetical protein